MVHSVAIFLVTGWLGGELVFQYRIGAINDESEALRSVTGARDIDSATSADAGRPYEELIGAGVLVVICAAAGVTIYAYWDQAVPLARLAINYVRSWSAPARHDNDGVGGGFKGRQRSCAGLGGTAAKCDHRGLAKL